MAADLPKSVPVVVALAARGADADADHNLVTKCRRCRLGFVRHPSIGPGDSPRWWLCPLCRTRLLSDVSKTDARCDRADGSQ